MVKIDVKERFNRSLAIMAFLAFVPGVLFLGGCATPSGGLSYTKVLQPDQEDDIGGSFIESADIRTVATQMAPAVLSVPEIANKDGVVRIAIAPIHNSTRYVIDKDIFSKRLRLELNKVSEGKVRFFAQGLGQAIRAEIIEDKEEDRWDSLIDQAAKALLASSVVIKENGKPLSLAVLPVKNTNLTGVNADSFTSLLRAKIADESKGKLVFLSREANGKVTEQILDEKDIKDQNLVSSGGPKQLFGADYFLTGEFIAKSISDESAVESVEAKVGLSSDSPAIAQGSVIQSRKKPNATKFLNVKLVDAETGAVSFEKLIKLEDKITSGVGKADYLLTGELSALSKASETGARSDYCLMSFQLVDPISNEIIWENAYETKKKTVASVIYR